MTAIGEARAPRAEAASKLPDWLRGIGVRQVRLATGLVMFAYILSHFFNHALGNISYEAMEGWLVWHVRFWRNPVVNTTLYGAAMVHFSLGLWALYQRRHFRYTGAEITQLILGLSIPLWLAGHFAGVRISGWLFGTPPFNYASTLFAYWGLMPKFIAVQFILLTVAWVHACIGLYFWLRLKSFFGWAAPILLVLAALLPVLAMLGTHHGGREVVELAQDQDWRKENLHGMPTAQFRTVNDIALLYFPIGYAAAILLVFVARGVRSVNEHRRGLITISYPDREVRVPKGLSVLEASMRYHIPHASVCGGRARCSTCRVRIVGGAASLPPPSPREAFVLKRVGVAQNPAIRLACQLRPRDDVDVIPILPPHMNAGLLRKGSNMNIGKERYIVSMFVDMRGSTRLAEARLPFDVVFLINRFIGAASQAVLDAGGQPNQFVGDGVLALFGVDSDPQTACRQALRAAAKVADNVAHMNRQFASDLREPIAFGIGIHGGEVIIGDIGFKEHTVFTALGDPVNVAARLQDMTKALHCQLVVSDEVCAAAGLAGAALPRSQVSIRGRDEPMVVRAVADVTGLLRLLEAPAPA
ncbi:MAG TPA: adenylate/guanylate cyclase domain-containing protein [Pseudolabrys sp.]|nr:adenylate/guanylate cyclase domain-containing protein [Pseudolabrys sp.]